MTDEYDPLGLILGSSGSRGDRLLFRYPYEPDGIQENTGRRNFNNPYIISGAEDFQANRHEPVSSISNGVLVGFADDILAHTVAAKSDLCGHKFQVTIGDVMFVGYPMLLQQVKPGQQGQKRDVPSTISFNVVFALRATCEHMLVCCYQELARQLATALKHEEKRCGYFSRQKNIMLAVQDDVANLPEDSYESPYKAMMSKSELAKCLKNIWESLREVGYISVYINNWVPISFCLPHKMYTEPADCQRVKPEAIQKMLSGIRPYHGVLLLVDQSELLKSLPLDASPSLTRLIKVANTLKNLQSLAADADLALSHVCQLVCHLVYWGKALLIYPLCESNTYVLSPDANTFLNANISDEFAQKFSGISLQAVLSEFSLPTSLVEHRDILGQPQQQKEQIEMVIWMLQRRLLVQLHNYVFFVPGPATAGRRHQNHSTNTGSVSDAASVFSDDTQSLTFSTKTPSVDVASDGMLITDDTRSHWRHHDTMLSSFTQQQDCVLNVPAASQPEDLKLFTRLSPYFNGRHHLEEIMFYENLRRSQLVTLLDKFRDVLITCQHEDPVITAWVHR